MISQEVQIYSIVVPKKGTPKEKRRYRVKWRIDGRDFSKQFKTKAEAERLRSRLQVAVTDGLEFNPSTGRPRDWERSTETWWTWSTTWLGLMWPQWSGNSRRSGVESLVAITPHLAKPRAPAPPDGLRQWLLDVGYRPNLDEPEPCLEVDWLNRWSIPLELVEAPLLETAVGRATTRLDGGTMSPNVVRRRRNTIKAAFSAAVRRQVLNSNPFDRVELKRPQRRQEVDVSTVPSIADLNELVARVSALERGGARYAAFFATIGLAGLRPSEAANLLVQDLELPDDGWGLARLRGATTSPGQRYTADGATREEKGLKHRATDAIREVPIPPQLVEVLVEHMDRFPSVDDRLFSNAEDRPVTAHNYGKVWRRERDRLWPAAHPCSSATTYDLRHTAATVMLQAGVSAAEAARRLGHSVDVLMRVYAGVFTDERERSNARIDQLLALQAQER